MVVGFLIKSLYFFHELLKAYSGTVDISTIFIISPIYQKMNQAIKKKYRGVLQRKVLFRCSEYALTICC